MSVDLTMQKALESDMAVINDNGSYDYIDNTDAEPIVVQNEEQPEQQEEQQNTNANDETDFFFENK